MRHLADRLHAWLAYIPESALNALILAMLILTALILVLAPHDVKVAFAVWLIL